MRKVSQDDKPPTPGLRERKKAKTRAAIQEHALRLFQEQGYDATTVEQIAEAAEVSPSTFFRYFPTKEDVVLYDDLDPLVIAAFEAQPPDLTPLQAMRGAMLAVFTSIPPEEVAKQWERGALILSAPELRMRFWDQIADAIQLLAALVAKRVGRRPDDPEVLTFAGAVTGAILSGMLANADKLADNFVTLIDEALAYLEAGMPL